MTKETLIEKLIEFGDVEALTDARAVCEELIHDDASEVLDNTGMLISAEKNKENVKKALEYGRRARKILAAQLKRGDDSGEALYWDFLRMASPYDFDSYCRYIERMREPEKRFYEPRRKQLYPIAKELQKLEDNELDFLAISMPPGTGKTTLALFYVSWTSGLHPELQTLVGSHSKEFLRGVYDELMRILDPQGEYLYADIFPMSQVCGTNALNLRIDLGKRKRFETIECGSIKSGLAGKVRATNLLYCDDLCESIEQAMNPEQMNKLWRSYATDLRQRKQGNRVRELHIQTRWSVRDVVGRLSELYEANDRAEFINLPALDENGNSNFDYPYGIGFTKEMYADLEASMDDASWKSLYLGEPIEREGQLYAPDELRRFFELPERDPDAVIAVCDTKEQGDDYLAMPIVYKYGDDYYIYKWICDNGKPNILEQRVANALAEYDVGMVCFESNRGGTLFAENVQNLLTEKGSHCHVTTKWNNTNKETRILVASSWVKTHCLFLNDSVYNGKSEGSTLDREYRTAMNQLTGYSMSAKNKHDDVADVMADLEAFVKQFNATKMVVMKRTF